MKRLLLFAQNDFCKYYKRMAIVMMLFASYANAQTSEVASIDAGVYSGFRNLPISLDGISNKSFITSGNLLVDGSTVGYTALYSLQGNGTFARVLNPVGGTSELPQLKAAIISGIKLDNSGTKGFILSAENTTKLYRINTSTHLLEDITVNLPAEIQTVSAPVIAVADIDQDGDEDIFFSRAGGGANSRVFLINDGSGVFTTLDVTANIAFLNNRSNAALFQDIDGDGYPELLTNGGDASGQTNLYKNNNTNGNITNTFSLLNLSPALQGSGYAGAVFLNANDDSRPDIFITGQPSGGTSSQSVAQLWLNSGSGTSFAKSGSTAFKGMRTAVGLLVADIDGDGKDDIIYSGGVSSNYDDPGNASGGTRTVLYLNSNSATGAYVEAVASDYFEGISTASVSYYIVKDMDANGDGNNDDFIVSKNSLTTVANNTGPDIFFYVPTSVLPIKLKSFTVKAHNNQAKIDWVTSSEENNDRFEVYSSADGVDFHLIKSIKSIGNSSDENNYTVYDDNPVSGTNYYRLVQYDLNGSKTDLGVRTINFKIDIQNIKVYPTPAKDHLYVNLSNYTGEILFSLYDIKGATVLSRKIVVDSDKLIKVSFENQMRPGIYTLNLKGDKINYSQKIIIKAD